jgi:hypothetical protein
VKRRPSKYFKIRKFLGLLYRITQKEEEKGKKKQQKKIQKTN